MRRLLVVVFVLLLPVIFGNLPIKAAASAAAVPSVLPSGERQKGQVVYEPAYDADTGRILYLSTPIGTPFFSKSNPHAQSPLYLVVYPSSSSGAVGVMNCAHQPYDNCADHGPDIADLAMGAVPAIYGNGVWGHDHIVDPTGGADFNVDWHVIVVLFTDKDAAKLHLTTENAIDTQIGLGHAFEVDTPIVFHCAVTAGAPFWNGTPLPVAGPYRPRP